MAEYLDMSPRLAGTGDDSAVRALMTGGRAVSQNSYWDIVEPCVSEQDGCRVVNGPGRRGARDSLRKHRMLLSNAMDYAVVSAYWPRAL